MCGISDNETLKAKFKRMGKLLDQALIMFPSRIDEQLLLASLTHFSRCFEWTIMIWYVTKRSKLLRNSILRGIHGHFQTLFLELRISTSSEAFSIQPIFVSSCLYPRSICHTVAAFWSALADVADSRWLKQSGYNYICMDIYLCFRATKLSCVQIVLGPIVVDLY